MLIIIIIIIIIIILLDYINPIFIEFDEFNKLFNSEMVILPSNFAAFGYKNYHFYIYCSFKEKYKDFSNIKSKFNQVLVLIFNYWIYNIHLSINKKEYYPFPFNVK